MDRAFRQREWIVGLIVVAILGTWSRVTVLPQIFVRGLVLPAFPDVHYHVRRIWQTLEGFPRVPVMDSYLNWPDGGPCPWPPGFDWLGAVFVAALGGASDPERAARTVAFFPILLGMILVGLSIWIARQLTPRTRSGDAVALAAGVLAALLPQAVSVSQLGRVDHHVAEAISMALLGGWVLWAARGSERTRCDWIRFECVGGAIAAWSGTVFNGSIVYVAIACSLLISMRLAEPRARRSFGVAFGSGGTAMLIAAGLLGVVNHAAVAEHGRTLDFRFPSHLQPLLHAVVAFGCFAAAATSRLFTDREGALVRFSLRVTVLSAASFAAACAVLAWGSAASAEFVNGWRAWLWRSDPWLAGITEFQPLFPTWELWRPEAWSKLVQVHGLVGLAAPVILPVGLWRAWHRHRAVGACFAGWTLALVALTLVQTRFGRVLTPNLAIVAALSLGFAVSSLARWLAARPRGGWRSGLNRPFAVFVATAALALSDPTIRRELSWQSPREPSALEAASLYLRSLPEARANAMGVLTKWDYGHTVSSVARRPVVASGFGPWPGEEGFREVARSLSGSEPELIELMERRRLDFLVTGLYAFLPSSHTADPQAPPAFLVDADSGAARANLEFFRAKPLSALILGGGGDPSVGIPHVRHLLPRFVSSQRIGGLAIPVFEFWVYERVPGVELRGRAQPGSRIVARTQLRLHGEVYPYTAWADVDRAGRFRLVISLPSGLEGAGLQTAPRYRVLAGDELIAQLELSESMIRAGEVIDL